MKKKEIFCIFFFKDSDFWGLEYPIFGDEIGCKGLLTGSVTRILGTDNFLYQINYYDYKGQVVQSRSTNHMGGYDHVYNQYNFTGNVTKNLKEHNIPGQNPVIELYDYTYDHALRPTTITYTLNNKPSVVLVSNKYDEFGRLEEKKRHNSIDVEEYDYNIRNWTTKIKSGTTFEENLYYNANIYNSIAEKCYNGNIAYSTWTYNGATKAYVYDYDDLNRLTEAIAYQTNGYALFSPNNKEKFEYDKQGNIERLWRDKDYTGVDFLQMTYNGNQITSITDAYTSQGQYLVKEYQDKAGNSLNEMSYDANGNMIKDLDRNIFTIKYNLLNLPDTIQFGNGNQIINQYDASGQKLYTRYYTVLYPEAVPIISTLEPGKTIDLEYNMDIVDETGVFYVNNYEYGFNGCDPGWYWIRRIHNPEGYFSQEPGTYQTFYYYRKDHLGNNREVWRSTYTYSNGDLTVPSETEQYTQYYPSGLPWKYNTEDNPGSQPYKYNGKEFVEMHGLDEYDSDARWYYPALMRTTTVDPLAEKYYDVSPYAWCGNNPVRFVDPTGMDYTYNYDDGEYQDEHGNRVEWEVVKHTIQQQKNDNAQIKKQETIVHLQNLMKNFTGLYNQFQQYAFGVLNLFANKNTTIFPTGETTVSYTSKDWTPDYVSLDLSANGIVVPVLSTGTLMGGGLFLSAAYTKGSGFSLLGGYKIGVGLDLSADMGFSMGFYQGNKTPSTTSLTGWGTYQNLGYGSFTGGASQNMLLLGPQKISIGNQWLISNVSIGVGLPVSVSFGVSRTYLLWP